MNLERAAGLLIAAVSVLAIASCSHRSSSATNPSEAAGRIGTFVLPAQTGADQDRWLGGIAAGPDAALWFTELHGGRIGRIATSPLGGIREYALPTHSVDPKPGSIALGPDGALWFTVPNLSEIGRITTTGEVTHYPIPTAKAFPQDIALGPDGALWFTERVGKIGRISRSGQITEFPIHTSQKSAPFDIAAGSDHALWFTEIDSRKIGRITTTGHI